MRFASGRPSFSAEKCVSTTIESLEPRRVLSGVPTLVDGSLYTLLDNAFNSGVYLSTVDFNGDGKIDGSDYSLIDSAWLTHPHFGTDFSQVPITPAIASITDPYSGIVVRPQNGNPYYSLDVTPTGIIARGTVGAQIGHIGPEDVIFGRTLQSASVKLDYLTDTGAAQGSGYVRIVTFDAQNNVVAVGGEQMNASGGVFSIDLPGSSIEWCDIDPGNNVVELESIYGG